MYNIILFVRTESPHPPKKNCKVKCIYHVLWWIKIEHDYICAVNEEEDRAKSQNYHEICTKCFQKNIYRNDL